MRGLPGDPESEGNLIMPDPFKTTPLLGAAQVGRGSAVVREETAIHEYRLPGRKPRPADLKPGRTFVIHFSKLPETLQQVASRYRDLPGLGVPIDPTADNGPMATFYLPAGYRRRRKTPLLVFLQGGYGGPGNWLRASDQYLADGTGSIAVNLPLIKAPLPAPPRNRQDLFLHPRDYPVLSATYRSMLSAINGIIPNIDAKRSVFGGRSHGAQATALLLGFSDKYVLTHFRNFILVDQGFYTLLALTTPLDLRNLNLLLLVAEKGDYPERPIFLRTTQWISDWAKRREINLRRVVMKNSPHGFPKRYQRVAMNWIRKMHS